VELQRGSCRRGRGCHRHRGNLSKELFETLATGKAAHKGQRRNTNQQVVGFGGHHVTDGNLKARLHSANGSLGLLWRPYGGLRKVKRCGVDRDPAGRHGVWLGLHGGVRRWHYSSHLGSVTKQIRHHASSPLLLRVADHCSASLCLRAILSSNGMRWMV